MPLIVSENSGGGSSVELIAEGVYEAVCFGVVDIGTRFDTMYKKDKHEVIISWEIPSERVTLTIDGEDVELPRIMNKTYTLSLDDRANLRKDLEMWRGKKFTADELQGFDIAKLIGVPAMLQVMHNTSKFNGNTYANINAVMPCKTKLDFESKPSYFNLDEHRVIPEHFPKWIKEKIEASQEWEELCKLLEDTLPGAVPQEPQVGDNVPF